MKAREQPLDEGTKVRFADILGLALAALVQHKLRTLLTTLGVVCGSFVLAASLSIRTGVQATIKREYGRHSELRRIDVTPRRKNDESVLPPEVRGIPGEMSAAKRERLRTQLLRLYPSKPDPKGILTTERLDQLRGLEGVHHAEPMLAQHGRVFLGERSDYVMALAAPHDGERFRRLLVAGNYLAEGDLRAAVVSELLLYRLGIVDDAAVEAALGKTLLIEFRSGGRPAPSFLLSVLHGGSNRDVSARQEELLGKIVDRLPEVLEKLELAPEERLMLRMLLKKPERPEPTEETVIREELTIGGVIRAPSDEEAEQIHDWIYREADVVIPSALAAELFWRLPHNRESGFPHVVVETNTFDDVKTVMEKIEGMDLQASSVVKRLELEQFTYLMIFTSMSIVASVALLVAALGIANTMLISVLERFREIGIMKAVGARDGHIQLIFLIEGAAIGVLGGILGLVACWGASFPGDAWARATVEKNLSIKLQGSLFDFPLWLLVVVPAFAILATTLAAYYPARQAARIDPIKALRHE